MLDESMTGPSSDSALFSGMTLEGTADWGMADDAIFHYDPADAWSPWDEAGQPLVFGDPVGDAATWQQQDTAFTCAVVAQRGILESFGVEVSESKLVYDATVNGWLSEGGTDVADVGKLLEHYGIPCHSRTGASLDDLVNELALGHKVIVGVDSGELWRTDHPLEDTLTGERADHAVQVTGVVRDEAGQVWVTVNDSGTPDGQLARHKWEDFADAWADGGNHYVATTVAPGGATLGGDDPQMVDGGPSLLRSRQTDTVASSGDSMNEMLNNAADALGGMARGLVDFATGEDTATVFGSVASQFLGLPPVAAPAAGMAWQHMMDHSRDYIARLI